MRDRQFEVLLQAQALDQETPFRPPSPPDEKTDASSPLGKNEEVPRYMTNTIGIFSHKTETRTRSRISEGAGPTKAARDFNNQRRVERKKGWLAVFLVRPKSRQSWPPVRIHLGLKE